MIERLPVIGAAGTGSPYLLMDTRFASLLQPNFPRDLP